MTTTNPIILSGLIMLVAGLMLPSCTGGQQPAENGTATATRDTDRPRKATAGVFVIDTTKGARYVLEVYHTNPARMPGLLSSLPVLDQEDLQAQLLIKARDSTEVVQITRWTTGAAADQYMTQHQPRKDYRILSSTLQNYGAKPEQPFVVDSTASVQYSEFLMKRPSALDTLSPIAVGMTSAMVQSQPTLDFIMTLNSTDQSTISLIGLWNTKEGYEIFAQNNTFGDKPYWEPYAENEHHMFDVVRALTYPPL